MARSRTLLYPYEYQPLTFLFEGTLGDDTLNGTAWADTMYGYSGNDRLNGGGGSDLLDGGNGNDMLEGGAGGDTIVGGAGVDTASYRGASIGVMLDLANGGITNDAAGDTYSGIENVHGSNFGDIVQGDAQANEILGFAGDDFLFGGAGNDRIDGGAGSDNLRGGTGNDILISDGSNDRLTGDDAGILGRDTFIIRGFAGDTLVTDFQRGFDKLDPVNNLVGLGADGRLAIGSEDDGWSNLDGDTFAFNVDTHTLCRIVHVSVDGQESTVFLPFAVLQGVDTLSASDFV